MSVCQASRVCRIAVAQICSTPDIGANRLLCQSLIQKAAEANARCIFFPEASDFIAEHAEQANQLVRSEACIAFVTTIQQDALAHKIDVCIGVHALDEETHEAATDTRMRNRLIWFNGQHNGAHGAAMYQYDKIHLFDADVPNGPSLRESAQTSPGTGPTTPFQTCVGKIGLGICFDLRFPEMAAHLRATGADILLYPSAFTRKTGAAHWEVLLRARAIETSCYVIASAQAGQHNSQRASHGHSMVVDPWGTVLAEAPGDVSQDGLLIYADVDLAHLKMIREAMPLHHREDINWRRS